MPFFESKEKSSCLPLEIYILLTGLQNTLDGNKALNLRLKNEQPLEANEFMLNQGACHEVGGIFFTPTGLQNQLSILHATSIVTFLMKFDNSVLTKREVESEGGVHQSLKKRSPIHILVLGRPQLKMTMHLQKFYRQIKEGILLEGYTLVVTLQPCFKGLLLPTSTTNISDQYPLPYIRQVQSQNSVLFKNNGQFLVWLSLIVCQRSKEPTNSGKFIDFNQM